MCSVAGRRMIVAAVVLAGQVLYAQNSPRVTMLDQQGWAAIKAGKLAVAVDAFREAIEIDPKNAGLHLGAGTAEIMQRHDPEAKAHLEQALVLDPKFTRARAQLAQV